MRYKYNDTQSRSLGFRCDEDLRTRLDDIAHAVSVLSDASERTFNEDIRTPYTFAALDYLASIATRQAALIAFRRGLDIVHPEERSQAVQSAMRSIRRALR